MPSTLGKYNILKTLGSGANSKVKLGQDKETGRMFAVKILKKDNPNNNSKFLELVMTEVHTMTKLSHGNIINIIEYNRDGVVEKSNGAKLPVIYIVLELATGGELFDYIATTGKFSDTISRFYFQQLLNGLDYVHSEGVTHRDLKPENVLFDQYFNLKIADFGFAAPIAGKDGSGYCTTKLGTESYMAPEIHARKPYSGASVDVFACGIILFIMYTQHPPFTRAEPSDPFYRLICANRQDLFWKAHSKNKPEGFFSKEFMDLITAMLQFDPTHRLSLSEVKAHAWTNGPICTIEDIHAEFNQRKASIDQEAEAKRQQAIVEKA
jgi:serine/threonine protein kinase